MSGIVLAVEVLPPGGRRSGLEVRDDGRLLIFEDAETDEHWTYEPDELDRLRTLVGRTDALLDRDRYGVPGRVSHPTRIVWHWGDRQVEVVDHASTPGPLQELYRAIFALHDEPEGTSLWRVRTPAGVVERTVLGEPAGVPELAPLVRALFADGVPDEQDGAGDPLVEVTWLSGGEITDRTRVWDVPGLQEAIDAVRWERLPQPLVAR